MRVLHISPCQGAFGGIEAFVLAVADELHASGEHVRVIFKQVSGFQRRESLYQAISKRKYPISFVPRGKLAPMARAIQWADVVHGHNPLLEAVLGSLWFRKPCVLTVYNWCRKNFHPRPLLWRMANRLATHSWYISDFVWDSWETDRRGTSGKLPIVSSLPSTVTPFLGRKGFIFASRWIPNKGIRTLLRAYAMCDFDKTAWPLTLLGDGPLKQEVLSFVEDQNIKGVETPGFLPDSERNQRISQAKWMVTPPNTNEDLGLTAIEARNVKVPCIITRDGGLPEAAGKFALSCEPGDADGLACLLKSAAGMEDGEYAGLSEATWLELQGYLKPLSAYRRAYRAIARSCSK